MSAVVSTTMPPFPSLKILNMRKGSGILNYTLERTDTENLPIGEQRCVTKGKKVAILEFMNRRGSEIAVT